jgi:hypothetical protein
MMSVARSRASESSVGKNSTVQRQSLSSCHYASKTSLRFVLKIDNLPVFRLPVSKLAVQGQYNMGLFSSVLTGSLQGIAERPLPCNYNVIQFVCALSRRKHRFKSRRGRQTSQQLAGT